MTPKTQKTINEIAAISEDVLRTDKALHDGFMKRIKDNGCTDARNLSFDETVQIIAKMAEVAPKAMRTPPKRDVNAGLDIISERLHAKYTDEEIKQMSDYWAKISQ